MATFEVYLQAEFPYKQKIEALENKFKNSVDLKLNVGKLLKSLTQGTFDKQSDPWGKPWKPSQRVLGEISDFQSYQSSMAAWASGGKKGKKPKRPKNARGAYLTGNAQTLLLTGRLRNSFEVVHAGNEVSFVAKKSARGKTGGISNVVYFPTHQWGFPRFNIPARPMMPIVDNRVEMPADWNEDILDLVKRWVELNVT
jgi:phage gpG-like protein